VRERLSRLHRAGEAVGCLQGRGDQVIWRQPSHLHESGDQDTNPSVERASGFPLRASLGGNDGGLVSSSYFRTSRTTTSMCEILRWSGGSGSPSTRIELPGMSTSRPSASTKK